MGANEKSGTVPWFPAWRNALQHHNTLQILLALSICFFEQGKEVFMPKRDVHTCFDVLEAPPALQPWFGRPPVTLHEVSQVAGIPTTELLLYVADCSSERVCKHDLLYPASTVWPMGFSWSSCVAQAATVACCLQAGVEKDAFMTMDLPPPNGPEACGVATDDTFFIHFDREMGQRRLDMLDTVMAQHGMPKNEAKDVSLQASMTALGCVIDSKSGTVEPAPGKLCSLFLAWIDVLTKGCATPVGINRALGLHQWFCLLQRPLFSVFDSVYSFARQPPDNIQVELPVDVRTEVAVATFLVPLLGADLRRRFLPQLTACDAAPDFGFGVAYMRCSEAVAAEVGSLAERRGDFVKFYPEPGETYKDRLGTPRELPFSKRQFKTAISTKAIFKAHSGALEAHGLLLTLKWLLRSTARFNHRLVILVDAKAVLGAASKGRTSAPAIRGVMRHLGALLLATNSLLRLVYVPTEHNPADAPSRGKPSGKAQKRARKSCHKRAR